MFVIWRNLHSLIQYTVMRLYCVACEVSSGILPQNRKLPWSYVINIVRPTAEFRNNGYPHPYRGRSTLFLTREIGMYAIIFYCIKRQFLSILISRFYTATAKWREPRPEQLERNFQTTLRSMLLDTFHISSNIYIEES